MKPLLLLLSALIALAAFSQTSYVIKNVSVIPMNQEIILDNYSVLVVDGKIKELAPVSKLKVPSKATVIDGTGKYLIPGLFDMHTHFFYEQGDHVNTCDKELKLMLANGITTARIMAGHPSYLEARENVRSGKWEGPELFVASPQLAGQWPFPTDFKNYELVTTKQQATEAVKKYKAAGYDMIKITFKINSEVYDAIIETAKKST